ncbi:18731_t:CDS:1, partial [Rhizophagus irregularis]
KWMDINRDCEKDLAKWIRTGKIIYKENIYVGIECCKGFVDTLNGGKAVVKLFNYQYQLINCRSY